MEIERKIFEAEIKDSNAKDLTVEHFISTERRDRGRDILYADGMKVEGRPVVMFQHGYSDVGPEPIAKNLWLKKGDFKNRKGIVAKTQFFPDELGQRLWQKNVEGYMPNWSVGWRALRHEFKTEKDGVEIRHVYEWELLEYSLVAVPMQPDAQTLPGKEIEQLCFKMLPEKEEKYGEIVAWKKDDEAWEEKPYPNEHACRLESPDKYIRIRRQNDKFGAGIHALWGIQAGNKPVELQAIRFDKAKFTTAEARAWLKEHKYTCKMFEPATGKCEKCGKEMIIKWPEDVSGDNCGKTCTLDFTYEHDGICEKIELEPEPEPEPKLAPVDLSKLKEFMDQLIIDYCLVTTDKLMELGKQIKDQIENLSAQVSALSEAGKETGEEAEPSELEIVDSDKDQEVVRAAIRNAAGEALGELTQAEIDKMRGKVK
jgi:hypothetical protein